MPGHSSELIVLPFQAVKKGTLSFSARIYAPRNQLVQVIEATAIQVKDAGVVDGECGGGCEITDS